MKGQLVIYDYKLAAQAQVVAQMQALGGVVLQPKTPTGFGQ